MATITKRKDGRYMAVVDLKNGGKKWLYTKGKNARQKIKIMAAELEDKVDSGNYEQPSSMTLEGFLKLWLENYCTHLKNSTLAGYKRYINNHVIPILGKKKLQKVKPLDIQKFYNEELEKGYKGKTLLQIHRILHKAFKDAVRNDFIDLNIIDKVDAPSAEDFNVSIYTPKQYYQLLEAVKDTEYEMPVLLGGLLGLRRGEVFGLTWKDIDFKTKTVTISQSIVPSDGQLHITSPKSSKPRVVTMPDLVYEVLKKKKDKIYGYVCSKQNGDSFNPGSFSRCFKEFLKKNKLPHIRFHDLRHFNATMMLELGIDVKVASERLGHSTPAITQQIYQHVSKKMDTKAAKKLNSLVNNVVKNVVKSCCQHKVCFFCM